MFILKSFSKFFKGKNTNYTVIKLFNKAFAGKEVDYKILAELATQTGYLVHPNCSTQEVLEFLNQKKIDFSSTFYQTWKDVTSKNRLELFIDQIIHYTSTYGTNFEGDIYLPEKTAEIPDFTNFKIILPIEKKEATDRCEKMLTSGIALTEETINDIFSIFKQCNYQVDVDIVKNKEAKMLIFKEQGILPTNAQEFVRYLIYLATQKTLLIKDKETIEAIKESKLDITDLVNKFGITELSSVFLRYKPIFLAFKKANTANSFTINRLRRLAKTNHQAAEKSYWENILTNFQGLGELPERLVELNNFKKITLLEAINIQLCQNDINVYPIRNGKIWLDKEEKNKVSKDTLKLIYSIIYQSLVDSLKAKKTTVKLALGVDIKLPKSEKSFVGNYPLGTVFDMTDLNTIIGINWKEVDGARDLDLSLTDIKGHKIGWNSDYYNESKSLIYSGDVTSASPEATELFYTSNGFEPSIVSVNLYNGEPNSKLKFFIANEKINNIQKNYMIDPNNILFAINMEMESRQMSLGIITENKFIISRFRSGNKQVAGESITNQYIQYTLNTLNCYISLEKLLNDAGFEFVAEEAEIDFTNLSKDTLITLLS